VIPLACGTPAISLIFAPGRTPTGVKRSKIGILLGDDIGLEVVPECVKVRSPKP
jgi:sorbitol-specific phosphotransferase system component IIBC